MRKRGKLTALHVYWANLSGKEDDVLLAAFGSAFDSELRASEEKKGACAHCHYGSTTLSAGRATITELVCIDSIWILRQLTRG